MPIPLKSCPDPQPPKNTTVTKANVPMDNAPAVSINSSANPMYPGNKPPITTVTPSVPVSLPPHSQPYQQTPMNPYNNPNMMNPNMPGGVGQPMNPNSIPTSVSNPNNMPPMQQPVSSIPSTMPPSSMAPGAAPPNVNPSVSENDERIIIWNGTLEWQEKGKGDEVDCLFSLKWKYKHIDTVGFVE